MTKRTREHGRGIGGITPRAASWLAWAVWTLTVAFSVVSLPINIQQGGMIILLPLVVAWSLTSSTVGTIIALRHPENPIGWILNVIGFLWASNSFFSLYAIRALVTHPGSLPAGEAAAWVASWVVNPAFGLLAYLFFLFPDGRSLSPRWRLLLWINGIVIAASIIVEALTPGPIEGLEGIGNPLGVEGYRESLSFVGELLFFVSNLLVLVSVASLFLRLRHAGGTTRQQIKWLAYAAALLGTVVIVSTVGDILIGGLGWWVFLVIILAFLCLPLSIGVAVLRYRLYDIDIIINRTLVYGSLTVMLALVYFGGVTATEAIFRALTGQEKQTQIAVVASTLVIAALFTPLRRRLQSFIDRRFYRSKYDAAKTMAAFNARLRDQTDLNALSNDLVMVASATVQPAHVSLWLRPDPEPEARSAALRQFGHDE